MGLWPYISKGIWLLLLTFIYTSSFIRIFGAILGRVSKGAEIPPNCSSLPFFSCAKRHCKFSPASADEVQD